VKEDSLVLEARCGLPAADAFNGGLATRGPDFCNKQWKPEVAEFVAGHGELKDEPKDNEWCIRTEETEIVLEDCMRGL
jgi:hypothetical protein